MIGDKKEPRSIRALKRVGTIAFFLMVGLAVAGLVLFEQRKGQIEEGQQVIELGGQLLGGISEINYYGRKMQIDGIDSAQPPLFSNWAQNLTKTLSTLQTNQFEMVKLQISANSRGATTIIPSTKWSISQNSSIVNTPTNLDLNLFDYITSSSGLQSANPSDLNFTLQSYTGLFSLLQD
jgi:hypothetical protein